MKIERFDSGLLHSNMYVISEGGHALVVDPCKNTAPADGYAVDWLLVTHEHYDHISGVNEWKALTGAPLLCSEACAASLDSPRRNMSRYFDAFCRMQTWVPVDETEIVPVEYRCRADAVFRDRMTFDWQGHRVTLLEIPGHSAGSIGIDVDGTDFFSGDSLLERFGTELRFPGGSRAQWQAAGKPRIDAVKAGTRIWPGHFEGFVKS